MRKGAVALGASLAGSGPTGNKLHWVSPLKRHHEAPLVSGPGGVCQSGLTRCMEGTFIHVIMYL